MASDTLELPSMGVGPTPIVGQFDPTSEPRRATPEVVQQMPKSLIDAVIRQESSGRPGAVGKKGELGLMQITPGVAQQYGVKFGDLANPEINRAIGTRYLNDLLKMFNGNMVKALAAYNAGPARVRRGDVPESTMKYVRKILDSLSIEGTAYAAEGEMSGKDLFHSAKSVSNPWEKAKPVAAPWASAAPTLGSRIEDVYGRYAPAVRKALGGGLEILRGGMPGPKGEISGVPSTLANLAVPPNAKQAAIQAALLASGVGEMSLPMRLALPTLTGMGMGALETQPDESTAINTAVGGIEGFAPAATGETAGALFGTAGRLAGKTGLVKQTTEDIGAEIGQQLPGVGKTAIKTGADIERGFQQGEILGTVVKATQPVRDAAASVSKGTTFRVPKMVGKTVEYVEVPLQQAEKALGDLTDLGFAKGGFKTQQNAKLARELAYRTRGEIAAQLDRTSPGMGRAWLEARRQIGAAQALTRLFKKGNVIDLETGELDQPAFVKGVLKNWDDLARNLGVDKTRAILEAARRGDLRAVVDILGEKPHMGFRAHPGGAYPHISPGRTYKPVGGPGRVPWYMGRSASFQPIPSLAAAKLLEQVESGQ